ncbi:lytic murein transglycosylase [Salinarimonas chemoclinalis]|uniref:lytic murein transglycosylase n=1 Tax=Salinarimonas chemoclinalis TaxID=3241599 RepID=UPI0035583E07
MIKRPPLPRALRALLALGLAATAGATALPAPAAAQAQFRSCLSELRGQAARNNVSTATFDRALASVEPDMSLLELLDRQPEFRTAIWDYIAGLVDEERVEDGRRAMAQYPNALALAQERWGVDRHVIVAIWGVESNYGRNMGKRPLLQSLSTLSCFGRRQSFFRGELFATLQILERGEIPVEQLTGSWAGAFGQTQFIPSTYQRLAVDFDGDGRRDIVGSTVDALGSTANYLARSNWRAGEPWGYEVRLPAGFPESRTGRRNKRALSDFAGMGVRRIDGGALTGPGQAAILAPSGTNGPAWVVFRNFDAIFSYNQAESYALAIALLSDRLAGRPGIQTPWPTDDPPLSREERREVQVQLLRRGYAIGDVDGIIGSKTREAIKDVQVRLGQEPTGRAGRRFLDALRAGG